MAAPIGAPAAAGQDDGRTAAMLVADERQRRPGRRAVHAGADLRGAAVRRPDRRGRPRPARSARHRAAAVRSDRAGCRRRTCGRATACSSSINTPCASSMKRSSTRTCRCRRCRWPTASSRGSRDRTRRRRGWSGASRCPIKWFASRRWCRATRPISAMRPTTTFADVDRSSARARTLVTTGMIMTALGGLLALVGVGRLLGQRLAGPVAAERSDQRRGGAARGEPRALGGRGAIAPTPAGPSISSPAPSPPRASSPSTRCRGRPASSTPRRVCSPPAGALVLPRRFRQKAAVLVSGVGDAKDHRPGARRPSPADGDGAAQRLEELKDTLTQFTRAEYCRERACSKTTRSTNRWPGSSSWRAAWRSSTTGSCGG